MNPLRVRRVGLLGQVADHVADLGRHLGDDVPHRVTDPDAARARYPLDIQPAVSECYVADLRATSGRRPHDQHVTAFIERLRADSVEFATLWNAAAVRVRRSGDHQVQHPTLGLIELECTGMLSEDGRQRLVWYSPKVGGRAAEQLRLLTVVGATAFPAPDTLG